MSSKKIMTAPELRAELARRGGTRRELADALGLSYSYVLKILQGRRTAEKVRAQLTRILDKEAA